MKFATFNLYQFAKPPFYWYEKKDNNQYSESAWEDKKSWVLSQLRALDADVVGFQEVFSVDECKALLLQAGYEHFAIVEEPLNDPGDADVFIKPVVAIASRLPLAQVEPLAISDDIKSGLMLTDDFAFSRVPIKAEIETPLGDVTVYVAHLKSKRPKMQEVEYPENESWDNRIFDTMKKLSRGNVASLLQRGVEATALYHDIAQLTHSDENKAIVVLGDLNDDQDSVILEALMMQNRLYEIGGIKQNEWPNGVKASVYDYRLYDGFHIAAETDQLARPFTHIYRGEGGVLDYVLVSNGLNPRNPSSKAFVKSYSVLNEHLKSDGVGDKKQSDHGQVVIQIADRNAEGDEPSEPEVNGESISRQMFLDMAGGVFQSRVSYRHWNGRDKWENFWQFFFDTDHGWVKSAYGAIPVSELHQKQRHSIEHIIPKSFLRDYLQRDDVPKNVRYGSTVNPFNFIPAERGLNSSRSSFPFDMEGDEVRRPYRIDLNPEAYRTTGLDAENEWVIPSRTRGDIARAILYMVLLYGIDELYNRHLDVLVHWAKVDPPNAWELAYNDWVASKFNIRNPLIAEPEQMLTLLNDERLLTSVLVRI